MKKKGETKLITRIFCGVIAGLMLFGTIAAAVIYIVSSLK